MTATDFFLLPLDPTRGLRQINDDLEALVSSDPRFQEAQKRVTGHLSGVGSDEDLDSTLWPAIWVQVRDRLSNEHDVRAIRRYLADGTIVKALDATLESKFDAAVLQQAVQEIAALTQTDSAAAKQIQDAQDELDQIPTTYGLVKVVLGFCLVVIVVGVLVILEALS